mmetsp:Transcript_24654/g.53440  ORF Transcript_24654/g.53440 Transcript_24654/m.53440 type:complete len:478 (+) Transcript_24654:140-1573(+)
MTSRRFTNRNNTPLPFCFIRNKIVTTFLPLLQCDPKYFVLLLLVLQNTAYVLLMRYSRTRPGTLYLSSTAVCCDEGIKLVTCLGIIIAGYLFRKSEQHHDLEGSVGGARKDDDDRNNDTNSSNNNESFRSYMGQQLQFDIRMAGLALFYTVQKNLLYLAISNLDAAVFQVTYQLKVLTTALFSVLLLKRKLTRWKIAALLLLTLGVALVQLDNELSSKSKNGLNNASSISYQEQRRWVGILAVLAACCTSGFGGVYFELVLKPNNNNSHNDDPTKENSNGASTTPLIVKPHPPSQEQQQPSVWAKNVQLSTFGLLIALFTSFSKDHEAIRTNGFFGGYDRIVVLVVSLQAFGGLVVAAIIKYADNILKNFATGASIVTSTLVNSWVFGFWISRMFVWGCVMQFVAIWLYSKEDVGGVMGNGNEEEEEEKIVGRQKQQKSAVKLVGPMNSGIALISWESKSDLENQKNACRRRSEQDQ